MQAVSTAARTEPPAPRTSIDASCDAPANMITENPTAASAPSP